MKEKELLIALHWRQQRCHPSVQRMEKAQIPNRSGFWKKASFKSALNAGRHHFGWMAIGFSTWENVMELEHRTNMEWATWPS